MQPINQKGGVPKFSGSFGRLLRRSYFLMQPDPDPTQPQPLMTFYGPGQRILDFSGNPPYSAGEPDNPWSYYPPDDWVPAGAILRAPQVVNLNPCGFFTPDGSDDPDAPTPAPGFQPQESIDEFENLSDLCSTVQQNINTLRPGRTWVTVDPLGTSSFVPGAIFNVSPSQTNPQPYFDEIAAPEFSSFDSPPSFFGTNFLNVWLGGGTPLTGGQTDYLSGYVGALPQFQPYKNSKANLAYAYPFFRGYATALFHSDVLAGPSQDFASDLYDFIASDLADFGFTHPGGTSLVTVDSLTALIAANFNFDPDTGADLS